MRGRRATTRGDEPRVSVFCCCGAQWHGGYAVDNPVLAYHAERCGPPIDRAAFEAIGYVTREPRSWREPGEARA